MELLGIDYYGYSSTYARLIFYSKIDYLIYLLPLNIACLTLLDEMLSWMTLGE
jgi:hypothetical protein